MCHSAGASFGVGAVLIPAGLYCLSAAARKDRAYVPLAVTPLVFGVQQCIEGCV